MSGIYINGMEMPTDNTVLLRIFPASENGECYVQQLDVDGDILTELWAVPVPPHGRCIDASERIKVQIYDDMTEDFHMVDMTIDDLLSQGWIEANAPTIIEAEEGE